MCVQAGGAKEHAAQFKKTLLHGEPLYISTDELDPKYIEDFKKALPDHEVRKPALPNHTVKAYQSQFVVHLLPCVAAGLYKERFPGLQGDGLAILWPDRTGRAGCLRRQ